MPTPCNNFTVPIFEADPCLGEVKSAAWVKDSSIYSELSLPANSSQQEINQAQYLAALNIKATIENIDATVSGLDDTKKKIEAGDNVEITGSGTTLNPYIVSSTATVNPLPYKIYAAIINQSGTSAPTATILENTIGDIVWTYTAQGSYQGTLSNAFVLNKTSVMVASTTINGVNTTGNRNTSSTVNLYSTDNLSVGYNGGFYSTAIEIKVYN